MKKTLLAALAVVMLAPLVAQASCESVKADITQKIVANGLPESGFKLDIVPNDQADQAGGQVVGHCGNDSQKIVYTKTADAGDNSAASPKTGTSQDSQ
ncbi:DUF1161 domain-containing protein [Rahnella sp. C60]|uniref:DUF1161 domain-containing protein n=1 Tax=Rahnella perminowiae TaxID=2816244 RepID=A0ABS6L3H6_9GAMM|nr:MULTISPECIES: DUF1161 domain-containing protein [Rahnella]UJD91679.1 DUF1161 domain-containing protein [Rahnella aquatilis]MBU9812126.1 DUF1161 domain-containing protein [Rahnella perminowiae]MBU9817549.1 DUF1161 domain-containing protein [Rahnella perminowiae]MBU9824638.1 DUF1161 domain-containing protein [Rahnella perminowiae]MBU9836158.1 DUF1161 domain-containing protein [Rahnella perminowiae]